MNVTLYREIDALGGSPNGDPLDAAFCDAIDRVLEILTKRGFSEHRDAAPAPLPIPATSGEGEKLREIAREEAAHLATINERDAAEAALSEAYRIVCGRDPQWSNLFGYQDAINDMHEAVVSPPPTPHRSGLST